VMKMPYRTEVINFLLIMVFGIICLAVCELMITPNPTTYPVVPSILWEFGYTLTMVIWAWPTALPIWILGVLYLINAYKPSAAKPETKDEKISRLMKIREELSKELNDTRSRLNEKINKIVYLEALLSSNECSDYVKSLKNVE